MSFSDYFLRAIFQRGGRCKFTSHAPYEIRILSVTGQGIRSAPECIGVMTVREERQGSRAISSFALLEQHR
jgi:hypothetical protein